MQLRSVATYSRARPIARIGAAHAPTSKEAVAEDVRTFVRVYGETHPGTSKARVRYLALDEFELDY